MPIEQAVRPCSSCEARSIRRSGYPQNHLDSDRKWQSETPTPGVPLAQRPGQWIGGHFSIFCKRYWQGEGRFRRCQKSGVLLDTNDVQVAKGSPCSTPVVFSTPPSHPPPCILRLFPSFQQPRIQPRCQARS